MKALNENDQVLILGSGTSTGVPMVGCSCEVCRSLNPKNKRTRTSIIIQTKTKKTILIDAGPDLRQQLLNCHIGQIDSVVITHDHADHTHGIDDLRPLVWFNQKKFIPVYTDISTADSLRTRFPYIFQSHKLFNSKRPVLGGGIPRLQLRSFVQEPQGMSKILIEDEEFEFFSLPHGYVRTLCFTYKNFGFITDCKSIPSHVIDHFRQRQLDLLIIDCLQPTPKDRLTHLTLDESLSYIEKIKPKRAALIHMAHFFDHQQLHDQVSDCSFAHIFPSYDGQILSLHP